MEETAQKQLIADLKNALKIYKKKSAADGRSEAAIAAVKFFIAIGVETRLLSPLVDLSTQNEYDRRTRKGNTKPTIDAVRLVLGSAAVSVLLEHSKMGRSLDQISKVVADTLEVDASHLKQYRKDLNAALHDPKQLSGRQNRDAVALYGKCLNTWFKPILAAHPQGGKGLEKFVLLLLKDIAPTGKTS
jgi:hypothetical protein